MKSHELKRMCDEYDKKIDELNKSVEKAMEPVPSFINDYVMANYTHITEYEEELAITAAQAKFPQRFAEMETLNAEIDVAHEDKKAEIINYLLQDNADSSLLNEEASKVIAPYFENVDIVDNLKSLSNYHENIDIIGFHENTVYDDETDTGLKSYYGPYVICISNETSDEKIQAIVDFLTPCYHVSIPVIRDDYFVFDEDHLTISNSYGSVYSISHMGKPLREIHEGGFFDSLKLIRDSDFFNDTDFLTE